MSPAGETMDSVEFLADQLSNPRRIPDLPPLQTTFPHKAARLQRPRPAESVVFERQNDRVPLQPGKSSMKRQDSQGGLRNLFSRNKASKPQNQEGNLSSLQESQEPAEPPRIGGTPLSPASAQSPTLSASIPPPVPVMAVLPTPPLTPKLKASPPVRGKSVKKEKDRPPPRPRPVTAWDPPPLFQAFPQAVKHAHLQTPTSSASSILRANGHRRNSSLRDDISNVDEAEDSNLGDKKKEEKDRKRSMSRTEWIQKTYVLVTSGYLLQYAGEGNFDRLPEKMMQIGKDSAAFASDAIPGKHWVLQISQNLTDEGLVPATNTKSLFSRLGFRGADARRTTRSFLLVFDNAEEMDSWLVTVRREIEAMGGRKYEPESGPLVDREQRLHQRPSRRYLVKRDPNQFGEPRSPTDRSTVLSFAQTESNFDVKHPMDSLSVKSNPRGSMARPSTGALSIAASNSTEQSHLEQLRAAQRLSYMSSGTRNESVSQNPSPPISPTLTNPGMPGLPEIERLDSLGAAITTTFKNSNRMSIQRMAPVEHKRNSLEVRASVRSSRPSSTYGSSSIRSVSPGTPNFSVPTTKRYSFTNNNPPPLPTPPLTASTLRPSPAPSPPTVEETPPNTADRPSSFLAEMAAPSRANTSSSQSRRHSHREHTPAPPNYPPPQPPMAMPSDHRTPPPSRPTSIVMVQRQPTPPSRSISSKSDYNPPRPNSSKSDYTPRPGSSKSERTPRPKRLSSLEHSIGIPPSPKPLLNQGGESLSRNSVSPPHPPPTIALPAVPWQGPHPPRPSSSQSHHPAYKSTGSRKLRRPVSMQVRSEPNARQSPPIRQPSASAAEHHYSSLQSRSSPGPTRPLIATATTGPVTTTTTPIPMIQGNAFAANPKLLPRKSMPALGPPAPPPDIPLPEVPVPTSSRPSTLLAPPEPSLKDSKRLSTEFVAIVPEQEEDMLPEERIMVQQERARAGKPVARRTSSSPGLRRLRRESQMQMKAGVISPLWG